MREAPPPVEPPDKAGRVDQQVGFPWGDMLVALGALALGAYFVMGAFNIRVLPNYARIGPRFFPFLVAAGLLLCGVLLVVGALRGERAIPEGGEDVDVRAPADWLAIVILGAAGLADILLIERLGFVPASAVLFWGVAFGFGSRHYLRDALVGLALSAVVYGVFTRLLDLNLPAGVLPLAALSLGG